MQFFLNLSTKAKLLTSFLIVILINVIIVCTSLNSMNNARNMANYNLDTMNNGFTRLSRVHKAILQINIKFSRALNNSDSAYSLDSLRTEYQDLINEAREAASVLRPDYFGTPEYATAVKNTQNTTIKVVNLLEKRVAPYIQQNKYTEALQEFAFNAVPIITEALQHVTEVITLQTQYTAQQLTTATNPAPIYTNAFLAIISIVVSIILAILIARYISNSVAKQITVMERIAGGDFTVSIPKGHKDEFGTGNTVMAKMCSSLRDILNKTQDECLSLQEQMIQVRNSTHEMSERFGDIQNQSVTVAAAADEMVSTTQDIARNCEGVAKSSTLCKDITSNGMDQVKTVIDNIRLQSEQTKSNAEKIESLAHQTREIGSIVSTIDDIADQTNLLALNAAIEAARAGEAGRGFAVVADEVRALALRTTTSTQEISKMVKNIQEEAAIATEAINISVTTMQEVADEAGSVEHILTEVTQHVVDVNNQITQIATAAEEQTTATGEISTNMQIVTNATEDLTGVSHEQSATVDVAYNSLDDLKSALAFFKTKQ